MDRFRLEQVDLTLVIKYNDNVYTLGTFKLDDNKKRLINRRKSILDVVRAGGAGAIAWVPEDEA